VSDFISEWGIPHRPDHEWNEYDLLRVWESGHVPMTEEEKKEFITNPILNEVLKFNVDEIVTCFGFSSDVEYALSALREIDNHFDEPDYE